MKLLQRKTWLLLPLLLLLGACGEREQPQKVRLEVEGELTKTFNFSSTEFVTAIPSIDLGDLNLGDYGVKGQVILEGDLDFEVTDLDSGDVEVVAVKVVKNRDKSGKDIRIKNRVPGSVDLTLFEGLSIVANDDTVLATVIPSGRSADQVYLESKVEDLHPFLKKGKLKVQLVVAADKPLPALDQLNLDITVTAWIRAVQKGHLSFE